MESVLAEQATVWDLPLFPPPQSETVFVPCPNGCGQAFNPEPRVGRHRRVRVQR